MAKIVQAHLVFLVLLLGGRDVSAEPAPVGTAYLQTRMVQAPPFGRLTQDGYPFEGVRMQRWRRESPEEVDWLVVWIDLQTPGIGYRVSPIHQRTGPGGNPIQAASAQNTRSFLEQNADVQLAVNTVAYWPFPAANGSPVFLSEPVWVGQDRQAEPKPGTWMFGLCKGRAFMASPERVRDASPEIAFGSFYFVDVDPPETSILLSAGQTALKPGPAHARTLAGSADEGRVLILVIADGYHPGVSVGLSLYDGARILQAAGATEAIVLDGGGSSTLVGREGDGRAVVINRPAGLQTTPGTLRYVAVNLGFTGLQRSKEPFPALTDWEAPWTTRLYCEVVTWVRVYKVRTAFLIGGTISLLLLLGWSWRQRVRRRQAAGGHGARSESIS